MRLFKRKPKVIRVKDLASTTEVVFDIKSLQTLKEDFSPILQGDRAWYGISNIGIFRYSKPRAKPKIRKVNRVSLPPGPKVELSKKELFRIAKDYEAEVLETADSYLLQSSNYIFIASKKEENP